MAHAPDIRLKVALIGCGQIADAHLQEIRKTGAQVVAVCDRRPDLTYQAAARFEVERTFERLDRMLDECRPDVLHVTTPPASHLPIALEALAAGVNVYIEKPFTIDEAEARQVIEAAVRANRLVCVGHDQLFDPIWISVRELHRAGRLGEIVHIDSLTGYNLAGPFGKTLSAEPDHWVHSLPGGLFHNTISHGLYRITDFLPDADPSIHAEAFGSIGSTRTPSELRVAIRGEGATAQLIFSSAMRPLFRSARLYGTRSTIEVDLDGQTIREYFAPKLPGAFAKLEAPFRHLSEALRSLGRNGMRFARSDIHYFAGMYNLFRAFYMAIGTGGEPPIPYAEILRVTRIMDRIFADSMPRPEAPRRRIPDSNPANSLSDPVGAAN